MDKEWLLACLELRAMNLENDATAHEEHGRAVAFARAGKAYTTRIIIRAMCVNNAEDSEAQYRKTLHVLGVADIDAAVARIWEGA